VLCLSIAGNVCTRVEFGGGRCRHEIGSRDAFAIAAEWLQLQWGGRGMLGLAYATADCSNCSVRVCDIVGKSKGASVAVFTFRVPKPELRASRPSSCPVSLNISANEGHIAQVQNS
jgi:hypothetical protein